MTNPMSGFFWTPLQLALSVFEAAKVVNFYESK